MNLLLDNRSGVPIYTQIYTQIRAQITDGTLKADEALPSIRNLAKDLRISVITTKRAYEELEKEGYIYTIAGKGSFVSPLNMSFLKEEKLRQIESHMTEIMTAAAALPTARTAQSRWTCMRPRTSFPRSKRSSALSAAREA